MRWLAASAETLVVIFCAAILVFGSAHAANTIVTAIVCSPSTGSVVTLHRPVSDSVVNNPQVTVSGEVTQAGTVDINVDGIYRSSLSMNSLNQAFQAVVEVPEGTHEIQVISHDICEVQDGSASAVITYHPEATPSLGPSVPTTTEPSSGQPTVTTIESPDPSVDAPGLRSVTGELSFGEELLTGVIDGAQPLKPVNTASAIVALPFVVGAGAFGWVHIRRI